MKMREAMAVACWPGGREPWDALGLTIPDVSTVQAHRLTDMMRPIINAHLVGEMTERGAITLMRECATRIVPGGRSAGDADR